MNHPSVLVKVTDDDAYRFAWYYNYKLAGPRKLTTSFMFRKTKFNKFLGIPKSVTTNTLIYDNNMSSGWATKSPDYNQWLKEHIEVWML